MEERIVNGRVWIHVPTKYKNRFKWTRKHKYIWELHNGKIPEGYIIHHKDCNPLNNELSNLQCMSAAEHVSLHHLGVKCSEERKRNIGNGNRGKKRTDEMNEQNRLRQLGKKHSEEHRKNIGNGNRGKKRSEEQKQKLSISLTGIRAYKVMNIETGCIYLGLEKAAKSIGATKGAIALSIKRKGKSGGYHWKYIIDPIGEKPIAKGEQT